MSREGLSASAATSTEGMSGESVRVLPRQDSVTDQLLDVLRWATAAGCYDAADWIASRMRSSRPEPDEEDGDPILNLIDPFGQETGRG